MTSGPFLFQVTGLSGSVQPKGDHKVITYE